MPVLEEQTALVSVKTEDKTQLASDPLAGRQLLCPYCHVAYVPEEGCFCVRVVGWDGKPLSQ
jgi:hypothetical protein